MSLKVVRVAMDNVSTHFSEERQDRDTFINNVIGSGTVIDSFVIDRGHVGGAEIHSITDTAIIIIRNQKTNKLITELVARPAQLRRLYQKDGRQPPKWLLKTAYRNNRKKYNEK